MPLFLHRYVNVLVSKLGQYEQTMSELSLNDPTKRVNDIGHHKTVLKAVPCWIGKKILQCQTRRRVSTTFHGARVMPIWLTENVSNSFENNPFAVFNTLCNADQQWLTTCYELLEDRFKSTPRASDSDTGFLSAWVCIDQLTDWLTDWLPDWLTDRVSHTSENMTFWLVSKTVVS